MGGWKEIKGKGKGGVGAKVLATINVSWGGGSTTEGKVGVVRLGRSTPCWGRSPLQKVPGRHGQVCQAWQLWGLQGK